MIGRLVVVALLAYMTLPTVVVIVASFNPTAILAFPPDATEPARLVIAPPFDTFLECQLAIPALYDAVVPEPGTRIEAACMRQGGEPA